jgi:hypothetical protein
MICDILIFLGIVVGRVRLQDHSIVPGGHPSVQNPYIAVLGVARTHSRRILNKFLCADRTDGAQKQKSQNKCSFIVHGSQGGP